MILDNDKKVFKKTSRIPLTPELMEFFRYKRLYTSSFIFYQDPYRSYIKFKEVDAETDLVWGSIPINKGQRYCYVIRLELYTISSSPVYTLYTVQDLKMFQKVLEHLEDFESKVKKQTLEIVKPIENLKN